MESSSMHARVFRASSTSRACASTTVRRCWLIASNRSIFAVAISKSCMVRFTSNRLNFTSDVVCTRIFGTEMAFSEYSVTVFVNSSCVIGRLLPALFPSAGVVAVSGAVVAGGGVPRGAPFRS